MTQRRRQKRRPECAFCGIPIIGEPEHAIHSTPEMNDGDEVALCYAHGAHETPTCGEIWDRIEERRARGERVEAY